MGSKVLLADDSVTIQKVVGIIFANEGYDLTIVSTGDEALRKAVEIKPDVLMVDALMPGKNGYEVCREIRQNPALSHTAILLMTGAFEVVDEEKNRLSGADEFITKPFESQTLIEATNRMIALTAQRASAAPAAPQAVPQPAAEPPAAAQSVDDVWATGFDTEPAVELTPEPVFEAPPVQAATVAPVKATADDDLWGAFDMDAIEVTPSAATTPPPVEAAPADDFFSFGSETPPPVEVPVEDEFILDEVAAEPAAEYFPSAAGFEPVGESEISFVDVAPEPAPVTQAPPVQPAAVYAEDDFSSISFDEPVAAPEAPVPPPVPTVVEAAPPVVEVAPPVVPPASAAPVTAPVAEHVAAAVAPAAPAALDEAQLKALLSSVSRDVIERIVWEVVPDLAEAIIKEEIRKLKSGIV